MRRARDGRVNLPHSQPVWVMEVRTVCKACGGTGTIRWTESVNEDGRPWGAERQEVCPKCDGSMRAWYAVHPGGGDPYTYLTRSDAERMLNTCYPDQCREYRLGATLEEAGVRVTECKVVGEQLVRVYDGSEV